MRHHDPSTVTAPKKLISKVDVLYDGKEDGFSLSVIDWEGMEHVGMRWNVAFTENEDPDKKQGKTICHGSPAANGILSWFILPRELFHPTLFDSNSAEFLNLVEA